MVRADSVAHNKTKKKKRSSSNINMYGGLKFKMPSYRF